MESGTIVRWLKAEGDAVEKGEPLYELDTDKVTQEVEAESDGVLLKIVVAEGEVDVGTTVGDHRRAGRGRRGAPRRRAGRERRRRRRPAPRRTRRPTAPERHGVTRAPRASRRLPPAEPAPPRPLRGSARGGRAREGEPARAPHRPRARSRPRAARRHRPRGPRHRRGRREGGRRGRLRRAHPVRLGEVEVVELTSTRRTIARRLTEAWQAPVFQLTVTADATELVATRERMVELLREGETKPTVSDVLTDSSRRRSCAIARSTRTSSDGKLHRFTAAQRRPRRRRTERARRPGHPRRRSEVGAADRRRSRRPRRRARATASSSSPTSRAGRSRSRTSGCTASSSSSPCSTRRRSRSSRSAPSRTRPTAIDGEFAIVPTLTMTLTCDHRAIDGSEGAEFLRDVKAFVESPALAL